MKNNKNDVYFGADDADKLIAYMEDKSRIWFESLINTNYLDKIKRSWMSYHGVYYEDSHAVSFGGEVGELVNLPVNHFRNIADHILTMVTATRPSFQARSVNTDTKSQIQTNLANGLLEYYLREKRLERELKKACQYAIVMGSGYIKMEWNSTGGEIYDFVEPEYEVDEFGNQVLDKEGDPIIKREGFPIYQGDVEFRVLSPFDVVFDSTKEDNSHDWQLCRSFKNKYDLAEKYPEYSEEIKQLQTKSDQQKTRISLSPYDDTVDVPVYEFFHKPTESLPQGRYVLYLSSEITLIDTVLPYKRLPLFRISPSEILGTPYGYTNMFDLIPLQDAANSLYSTVLTNQNAFGVQNLYVERGADILTSELSGGLNIIEGNSGFNPPKSLNLTETPAEVFKFIQMLIQDMETISGVNSVARGNPESSLKSGNALALVQSQALQFISGLQQSYIQLIEDVGTNLVDMLKDFASVPRIAQIAGKSNQTYMKEFTGSDLSSISRVIVDAGNPLSNTTAGKVQMAEQMMQMGIIKSPEQYISVMNTGKLETMTEGQNKQLLLVRAENERLVDGNTNIRAVLTDNHSLHLREHSNVLADPDLRLDQDLVERTLTHMQEHINILSDPNVANVLVGMGQQPMGPPGGSPNAPGSLSPDQPPASALQEEVPETLDNPQAESVMAEPDPGTVIPQPAQPAGVSDGILPEQPTTPEQAFIKQTGG